MPAHTRRHIATRWLLIATCVVAPLSAPSGAGAARGPLPDFDARRTTTTPPAARLARSVTAARAVGPGVVAQPDPYRGGTRMVRRVDGFLTGASTADPAAIVLGFLHDNPQLFNLTDPDIDALVEVRRWRSIDGVTHLTWQQRVAGVAAFDNGLRAHLTDQGQLISIGGSPLPGVAALAAKTRYTLGADAARQAARRGAGVSPQAPVGLPRKTLVSESGALTPAWQVRVQAPGASYDLLVDGQTGRLLRRQNLVTRLGRVSVYENYPGAAHGGVPTPRDITPWLTPGNTTSLAGGSAHAFADLNGNQRADPGEDIPSSGGGDWLYPFSPFTQNDVCKRLLCAWDSSKPTSWRTNLRSDAVQAFYYVNSYYQRLVSRGFTEQAGNFQARNLTGQGKGGDPIVVFTSAEADAYAKARDPAAFEDLNNAYMETTEDGKSPHLTLLLNATAPGERTSYDTLNGFDPATVYHEMTHGLNDRLVVDERGVQALSGQGGAMDEGLADWFAYSFLNANGSEPDGPAPDVRMFKAETPDRKGIRTQPLDCPVGGPAPACPGAGHAGTGGYTYGDYAKIDAGPEVHADGEIWSETMWDLRSSMIAAYGPEGIARVERLMVSALQLSLPFPSFLDMRNALLDADRVAGGPDQARIWAAFAQRGMGFFASTSIDPEDPSPAEDFHLPPAADSPRGVFAGTVTDVITKKPVPGAQVIVSGQLTGITAKTDSRGRFSIPSLPVGTYPLVDVFQPGYDVAEISRVTVKAGLTTTRKFKVLRNWGSSNSGARVTGANGPRHANCGPGAAIDQDPTSWVTTRGRNRHMTIKLARPVDILIFGITPGINCPDSDADLSSSAALLRIDVAGLNKHFRRAVTRRFRRAQNDLSVVIDPGNRTFDRTRYVRVTLLRPQGPRKEAEEPEVSYRKLIGLGELEVYGIPSGRG